MRMSWCLLACAVHAACSASGPPVDAGVPALRVISFVPSATDVILALGEEARLIARTEFDEDVRLASLPSIGGPAHASIESIVSARPDLVLLWRVGPGSHLSPRLEELGIRTVALGTETLPELLESIDTLGVLLDRRARTDSLHRAIVDTLAVVRAAARTRRPLRVFYMVWRDPPMTAGAGTFIDEIIRTAGGSNIYHNATIAWPQVAIESLVRRDPDVILVPRGATGTQSVAALCDDPVWRHVRAVRRGHVLEVDERLYNRPGPRVGRAARELLAKLDSIRRGFAPGTCGP